MLPRALVSTREMRREDVPEVLALACPFPGRPAAHASLQRWCRRRSVAKMVAERAGGVVGFCAYGQFESQCTTTIWKLIARWRDPRSDIEAQLLRAVLSEHDWPYRLLFIPAENVDGQVYLHDTHEFRTIPPYEALLMDEPYCPRPYLVMAQDIDAVFQEILFPQMIRERCALTEEFGPL